MAIKKAGAKKRVKIADKRTAYTISLSAKENNHFNLVMKKMNYSNRTEMIRDLVFKAGNHNGISDADFK